MSYTYEYPRPQVTCDVVVVAGQGDDRAVLLIRRGDEPFKGFWALPGGFLGERETLEACAARELAEETGLTGLTLQQVRAYSDPDRDPRARTITVAFVARLDRPPPLRAGDDAGDARWWPLATLPDLAFDHDRIIADAIGGRCHHGDTEGTETHGEVQKFRSSGPEHLNR